MSAQPSRDTDPDSRISYGWCAWHRAFSNTVRLVQAADQGSGHNPPGLFACASCRDVYHLTPLADQP